VAKPGLFVTATDTEVGKTVVAGGLVLALRAHGFDVGVMKPAATGCRSRRGKTLAEDVEFLMEAAATDDERELVCPYMLRDPLAPQVAAEREDSRLDIRRIRSAFQKLRSRHDAMIVEGAGGVYVPLRPRYYMLDLMSDLGLPALVVIRPALGTINHTLLTLDALRARKIPVAGVIMNNYPKRPSLAERTNPEVLRDCPGVPFLGVLPRLEMVSVSQRRFDGLQNAIEEAIDVGQLVDFLRRNCR